MHDIKFIRNSPQEFEKLVRRREIKFNSKEILQIDNSIRSYQTEMQHLQEKRNKASKEIKILISKGSNISSIKKNITNFKVEIIKIEEKITNLRSKLNSILVQLPNLLEKDVPNGKSESDNQFVRSWGKKPLFTFKPLDHVEIGEKLNLIDFKTGVKISGSRFVLLKGKLALLERALSSFMIDTHLSENNFEEVSPPYIVKEHAVYGTGQLPKFSDDLFHTTDNRWLIPTAEVPLTNIVSNEIIEKDMLPLRFVASTPCFRSEAGAAGSDTRGMIRQHQFSKVEMVFITDPLNSDKELNNLVNCAEKILQKLELPYRVMKLCSGDVGFSAKKTFDLEL